MACEPCENSTAATDALALALTGPAKVSGDAGSVESHSLADLIAADRYLKSRCAGSGPRRGLRFTQLIPPGAS